MIIAKTRSLNTIKNMIMVTTTQDDRTSGPITLESVCQNVTY